MQLAVLVKPLCSAPMGGELDGVWVGACMYGLYFVHVHGLCCVQVTRKTGLIYSNCCFYGNTHVECMPDESDDSAKSFQRTLKAHCEPYEEWIGKDMRHWFWRAVIGACDPLCH